jgi:hypothetical protein
MAAAYPMLLAMGAAAGERWAALLPRWGRRSVEAVFFTGLAVCGAYLCALILPLASAGPLKEFALQRNGDLREEIGWPELVQTVAGIRDSLPPISALTSASLSATTARPAPSKCSANCLRRYGQLFLGLSNAHGQQPRLLIWIWP